MKKMYFSFMALLLAITINAQTTIDISSVDEAYTTTFEDALVIDVATAASVITSPNVSFENPLMGETFTEAEISFDVYNYHGTDSIRVLGSLLSIFDADLGRMYFSNGSYLGFNNGLFFDANLVDFALGTDFLGGNAWKNVKLQFTASGYALYVDDVLAYNQSSTDVTLAGDLADYNEVLTFLASASSLVIGTGSWWSDNTRPDGTYWDAQFSYMKNITISPSISGGGVSVNDRISDEAVLLYEEYFTVTGAKVSSNFETLSPGIYIKRSVFDNGSAKGERVVRIVE